MNLENRKELCWGCKQYVVPYVRQEPVYEDGWKRSIMSLRHRCPLCFTEMLDVNIRRRREWLEKSFMELREEYLEDV